jgi:surface antigen
MRFKVNIRARLERHARNSHVFQKNNVLRIIAKFKIFSLILILILPVYPSFGALGGMDQTAVGDYDESTILMAYEDDASEGSMFAEDSGFIRPEADLGNERDVSGLNHLIPYTIQNGDSYSSIADKFNISVNSIIWANGLSKNAVLKPGQSIKIPPVSGLAYKVQPGDTIDKVSEKFKAPVDKILAQNKLKAGQELLIGQDLIIPGAIRVAAVEDIKETGAKVAQAAKPKAKDTKKVTAADNKKAKLSAPAKAAYAVGYTGNGKGFAWGNCTYYVANHKNVKWRGNANQWLKNAAAAGVPTGSAPAQGAIISFSGRGYNPYYGHVGIVVDIDGDDLIVKDMNYRRLNEVTIRRVAKTDSTIRGYIYTD